MILRYVQCPMAIELNVCVSGHRGWVPRGTAMPRGGGWALSPAQFLYRIMPTCSKMLMSLSFKCWTRIHDKEGNANLPIKDIRDCQCIAHRDFYGLLRSDVTCASCGFTSTTHDPCMDISLYLSACNSSRKDFGSKSGKPSESLVGCLDLFI